MSQTGSPHTRVFLDEPRSASQTTEPKISQTTTDVKHEMPKTENKLVKKSAERDEKSKRQTVEETPEAFEPSCDTEEKPLLTDQRQQKYKDGYQSIEGNGCDKPPGDEMLNENTRIGVTPDVPVVWCCPACRVGYLQDDFTWPGVLCAILLFPVGLICCFLMRQRRCSHCGAIFS